jgi:hypothetical protein
MSWRRYVGLGVLLAVVIVVVAITQLNLGQRIVPPPQITVVGTIGSEKANLLDDPKVKQILHDSYGITVDYRTAGSITLVEEDVSRDDFLWPSSQFARDLYEQNHGSSAKSETLFNSPLVLYAWKPVAQALADQGIASQESGVWYVNLPRLTQAVEAEKAWSDLGVGALNRKVLVYTTDPTKSNSGLLFAGLLATSMNGGEPPTDAALGPLLPRVQSFFTRQGFLQTSSGYLFDQFLVSGMGAYPIIVGYENQLIEYGVSNPNARDLLNQQITLLYPRPSMWATHTFIALNPKGERLLAALKDPAIQKLAWEGHGFRSGLLGAQNDPRAVQVTGVATTPAEAVPMPSAAVMQRIIATLSGPALPTPNSSP